MGSQDTECQMCVINKSSIQELSQEELLSWQCEKCGQLNGANVFNCHCGFAKSSLEVPLISEENFSLKTKLVPTVSARRIIIQPGYIGMKYKGNIIIEIFPNSQ